ncbi:MAG: hypothetical protein NZ889_02540 [Candidatus Pacearchaeota archaeon]|nr:hypothetical protein [Candidatus Pacearchaeota archaeon]
MNKTNKKLGEEILNKEELGKILSADFSTDIKIENFIILPIKVGFAANSTIQK